MNGGLKLDGIKRKDYIFERVFGGTVEEVKPIGRDISSLPVVYQGNENTCVSCSFTFIKQWQDYQHPDLSHEWLAEISNTAGDGATMRQVAEATRKTGICTQDVWSVDEPFEVKVFNAGNHRLDGYFFIRDINVNSFHAALKETPIIIGVENYQGVGPHAMVAIDWERTSEGIMVTCANWWKSDVQDIVKIPFQSIITAVVPMPLPQGFTKCDARLSFPSYLFMKLENLWNTVL